jgi:ABC-2 type transport system permease protein
MTSSAVMPTRLVLTDVPAWQVALSLALLLGSTWLLRRAAARIFAVGMLLFGNEASWKEVRRWARES